MGAGRAELFPHGADVGVRGRGPTVGSAFEQAALALTSVVTDPAGVVSRERSVVECEAPDREQLLVDFMNEIVSEMSARRMVFGELEVTIEGNRLRATVWGEPVDLERHAPEVEPKGVTSTELRVAREGDEWIAQCVVDV